MQFGVGWFQVGLGVAAVLAGPACASESSLGSPSGSEASQSSDSSPATEGESSSQTDDQGTTVAATSSKPDATSHATTASASQTTQNGMSVSSDTRSSAGTADEQTNERSTQTDSQATGEGSPEAIEALTEHLEIPREERPDLQAQAFAQLPLSKQDAERASALLWQDHVATLEVTRRTEHDAKSITLDGKVMPYDYTVFGEAPPTGHSLVLSLHGGGEADASVNDQQWENQKQLYTLDEGIYLAPRAPTNTWNLWHEAHIDSMFTRLIENFIALEGVDPNRVYVMGYSAGGDGVYQLGPRMADQWAAASAMAGHPNEARPFSLRNIGFTIHVGGDDTAFDRNLVAVDWRNQLDELQSADPQGYEHVVEVHAGKGHWMDLEDAVAVPWMTEFTRNPVPNRVVWYQDDILHERFYWLRALQPVKETTVVAELNGQTVTVRSDDVAQIAVRLRDDMLDLDKSVSIVTNGETVFEGVLPRTIATLYQTLAERGDPTLVFAAETAVQF